MIMQAQLNVVASVMINTVIFFVWFLLMVTSLELYGLWLMLKAISSRKYYYFIVSCGEGIFVHQVTNIIIIIIITFPCKLRQLGPAR